MPGCASALLPASVPGDDGVGVKKPKGGGVSTGSASRLPVPTKPPCTMEKVTLAAAFTWLSAPCAPPGPVLPHRMQLAAEALAAFWMRRPATAFTVDVLFTKVQLRTRVLPPEPVHMPPPPPVPVAVLSKKMQSSTTPPVVARI